MLHTLLKDEIDKGRREFFLLCTQTEPKNIKHINYSKVLHKNDEEGLPAVFYFFPSEFVKFGKSR